MLMQLELLVDFNDIIESPNPVDIIPIYEDDILYVIFQLKEQYTGINEYLKHMCFCHTNALPLIKFKYNDDTYMFDKHVAKQECVYITDKHIVIRMPFYSDINPSSIRHGGMHILKFHKKSW